MKNGKPRTRKTTTTPGASGIGRKDHSLDITKNNTLTSSLSGFTATLRERTSLRHEGTLAAVTGVRESIGALNGRSTLLSDTIKEVMTAFRNEVHAVGQLATGQRQLSSLERLQNISDLIEQLMNEVLSFNVTEYRAIKELIQAVLAASRHELSQTPPASFEPIRFLLEPQYTRNNFSSQSLRTALRSQATKYASEGDNQRDQFG
ncbi:MAG: hypothetical protein AB7P49_00210 [Bdellovibrionales bacterium]